MNLSMFKKDINLIFRNRTALISIITVLIMEAALVLYSRQMILNGKQNSVSIQFNYLQNYILIFYFPLILTNILILSFSIPKEKTSFMMAKLIPFGENTFLRSKVSAAVIISVFLSFPFLYSGIFLCGLESFQNMSFLVATSFYLFFFAVSLSSFSVFYAVSFYDGGSGYEPGVKGIIGMMFFISVFVITSFMLYSRGLRHYYNYATGFRHDYPNIELISMISAGFVFLLFTRLMLRMAEKKLIKE
jgi:hypothetical protein